MPILKIDEGVPQTAVFHVHDVRLGAHAQAHAFTVTVDADPHLSGAIVRGERPHVILFQVAVPILAPVVRLTLGPVVHVMLVPAGHAILVPEVGGNAQRFVSDQR